jgi:RNA polymerase sigma-70 factor, ECF subfamily
MNILPDSGASLDPADWLARHGACLYRYALIHVRDEAVAEGLVLETLLAALRSNPSKSSERTWLLNIMRSRVSDHLRHVDHQPALCGSEPSEHDWFEADGPWQGHWREDQAPTNWPADAESIFQSQEFWLVVKGWLETLTPQMACAFTLREVDGLSSEEICDVLEVNPSDLSSILHVSRAMLRQYLESEWIHDRRPAAPVGDDVSSQTAREINTVRSQLKYGTVAA